MDKIRSRFAPSPTGLPHIGHLRTALYSYALAKSRKGDFILRIEDTDRRRYDKKSEKLLIKTLKDFAINWDEYYVQSQRAEEGVYKEAADRLFGDGFAFYCQCKPRNARLEGYSKILRDPCRDKKLKTGAVKLKTPDNEKIGYFDLVFQKEIAWNTSDVADTTLLKSEEFDHLPTYHLAVVVDDHDMRISHILRGYDWLPSTPVHLLVYKYLGYEVPEIGHLTDIQSPQGGKLSKRKGSTSIQSLLREGYLPEAILNFVMLLGWAPKDNRELFSLEEFVNAFDPKGLQKSNPVFNQAKLDWFNGEYIRRLPLDSLNSKFQIQDSRFKTLTKENQLAITALIQERIVKLGDFENMAGFFLEEKKVIKSMLGENYREQLKTALEVIGTIKPWNIDSLNSKLMLEIKERGFKIGDFFMDLRVAITGSKFTPPINESIILLGRDEVVKRIKAYL